MVRNIQLEKGTISKNSNEYDELVKSKVLID
jgi:hypothetical protein